MPLVETASQGANRASCAVIWDQRTANRAGSFGLRRHFILLCTRILPYLFSDAPFLNCDMRIGYARVSTDEQALDLQRDALKQAKCRQIYEEHASGKNANRPKLYACL